MKPELKSIINKIGEDRAYTILSIATNKKRPKKPDYNTLREAGAYPECQHIKDIVPWLNQQLYTDHDWKPIGYMSIDLLRHKTRLRSIGYYRMVIASYLRKQGYSLTYIGIQFGYRDHTTIINALDNFNNLIPCTPELKSINNSLLAYLRETHENNQADNQRVEKYI